MFVRHGPPATRSLFKQFNPEGTEDLDQWRLTFVDAGDPHEVLGARALGFSWKEWNKFKERWPYFATDILPEWLEELEVVLQAKNTQLMIEHASYTPSAAKWLAERGWNKEEKKEAKAPVGRPSKEAIAGELAKEVNEAKAIDEDETRLLTYLQNRDKVIDIEEVLERKNESEV